MSDPLSELVLFEDNHCLAVDKPAGWPSAHFDGATQTVDQLARLYLKEKYNKPGKVFLGVVHRLDKPVSGVLLFARTSKSAARLSEQFRNSAVDKVYWAVVQGIVEPIAGTLEDWLSKEDERPTVDVVSANAPGAKACRLHYQRLAVHQGQSLVEVRPQTGRRHQIRVQFASRGHPIVGDHKYGHPQPFGHAIGLHARSLTFLHPTLHTPITLTAEPPPTWRGRFAHLLARRENG